MTPEERATRLVGELFTSDEAEHLASAGLLTLTIETVATAITEAVAEERERCAKLCETGFLVGASELREAYHAAGIVLAAAIRSTP